MRFHYEGKYSGDPDTLKNQRTVEGAIMFKEPSLKGLSLIANGISVLLLFLLIGLAVWRSNGNTFNMIGFLLAVLSLLPHEYLHALCYKGDVYFYTYLSKGLLFVVGEEDMTKARFVFMSMLPNLVFGFVPYILFLLNPSWTVLGTMGVFGISFVKGDYINVFNALTQMPKKSVTYLYRQNSFWYIP